ncbi:hypothetical protein TNCV_2694471 [Trichonephila clavipes]|nr:hypothetical protein TNCV_2694471 [Trichonephila clavipes]
MLANFAFFDYPATEREVISLQYFVDGLKYGEIQKAVIMADVQDLKSALLYVLNWWPPHKPFADIAIPSKGLE